MGPEFLMVMRSATLAEDSQRSPLVKRLIASLGLNDVPTNHSEGTFQCLLITDGLTTKVLTYQIHSKLTINNRSNHKQDFNAKLAQNLASTFNTTKISRLQDVIL